MAAIRVLANALPTASRVHAEPRPCPYCSARADEAGHLLRCQAHMLRINEVARDVWQYQWP
eukprot:7644638-Lingulodinium_polyedra.AAC.1